jgi:hypothetical protein
VVYVGSYAFPFLSRTVDSMVDSYVLKGLRDKIALFLGFVLHCSSLVPECVIVW